MRHRGFCTSLVLALATAPAFAQPDHEQHHPPGTPPAASAPGMPDAGMGRPGGMPMTGMMRMMMGRDGMAAWR